MALITNWNSRPDPKVISSDVTTRQDTIELIGGSSKVQITHTLDFSEIYKGLSLGAALMGQARILADINNATGQTYNAVITGGPDYDTICGYISSVNVNAALDSDIVNGYSLTVRRTTELYWLFSGVPTWQTVKPGITPASGYSSYPLTATISQATGTWSSTDYLIIELTGWMDYTGTGSSQGSFTTASTTKDIERSSAILAVSRYLPSSNVTSAPRLRIYT